MFMPSLAEDTQPVLPADLGQLIVSVSGSLERRNQFLIAGRIAYACRNRGSVKIRAKRDAIYSDTLHQVINMTGHVGQWRI